MSALRLQEVLLDKAERIISAGLRKATETGQEKRVEMPHKFDTCASLSDFLKAHRNSAHCFYLKRDNDISALQNVTWDQAT